MTTTTARPLTIANLVPPSGVEGFGVPAGAIGAGFTSEIVALSAELTMVNELDRTLSGLMYVDAGLRAQATGHAAVFINTVGDYGLRELRAALQIPVVGAGQSSFQVAAGLADRFGILTVYPKVTATIYRRLLSEYGVGGSCIGVRHVAENEELPDMWNEDGLIGEMRSLRESALDRLVVGGRDLLQQGAEVIVLGCTCMSPAADELQQRLGCPVVNPLTVAHKTAEMLVTLGLAHPAPPVPATLGGLLPGLFGGLTSTSSADDDLCGDTCSVLGSVEPALA